VSLAPTRVWRRALVALSLSFVALLPLDSRADVPAATPQQIEGLGIDEHLGAQLPLEARFRDQQGNAITLGDVLGPRPAIVDLMVHGCTVLCSVVLDRLVETARAIDLGIGRDYDVIAISMDPEDSPAVATEKRRRVLERYARDGAAQGIHFLVAADDEGSGVKAVAAALGVSYRRDPETKQWMHPAATFVVTPDGRVARYMYGVEQTPRDLRLSILEASEGRTLDTADRLMLFCYRYDGRGRRWALAVPRLMRAGGATLLVLVGGLLAVLWRRERMRVKKGEAPRG
jgi:protein SCO1/2